MDQNNQQEHTEGNAFAPSASAPLLVFGPHPDDIEFGCGGIVAKETLAGRQAHFVVCSLGEAATNGTPEERANEARTGAAILKATIEFVELDGDSHLEIRNAHAIKLAEIIRRIRPSTVLAPTCVVNQHPDHSRLGEIVRDAARLARYGGLKELLGQEAHSIEQLFYYAITPEAESSEISATLIDISEPEVIARWTDAMDAHCTQALTRNYVELQLIRARLFGARAGVGYAMTVFSNDPLLVQSLSQAGKGARQF